MAFASDDTTKEIVLAESDFLFGLAKSDKRHAQVIRSLEMHKSRKIQIQVLSAAVVEVRSVLYSRGLGRKETEDIFALMSEILSEYGVDAFTPVEPTDVVVAERMRAESPALTFFDSLYAATSKRLNLKLLSSEGIYSRIGLAVVDLDTI